MPQCGATDFARLQVGVGDLIGHAECECEIGEVEVTGRVVLIEVDAARGVAVVQPGVAQGVHRVHDQPRGDDAADADRGRDLGVGPLGRFGDQEVADASQACDAREQEDEIGDRLGRDPRGSHGRGCPSPSFPRSRSRSRRDRLRRWRSTPRRAHSAPRGQLRRRPRPLRRSEAATTRTAIGPSWPSAALTRIGLVKHRDPRKSCEAVFADVPFRGFKIARV